MKHSCPWLASILLFMVPATAAAHPHNGGTSEIPSSIEQYLHVEDTTPLPTRSLEAERQRMRALSKMSAKQVEAEKKNAFEEEARLHLKEESERMRRIFEAEQASAAAAEARAVEEERIRSERGNRVRAARAKAAKEAREKAEREKAAVEREKMVAKAAEEAKKASEDAVASKMAELNTEKEALEANQQAGLLDEEAKTKAQTVLEAKAASALADRKKYEAAKALRKANAFQKEAQAQVVHKSRMLEDAQAKLRQKVNELSEVRLAAESGMRTAQNQASRTEGKYQASYLIKQTEAEKSKKALQKAEESVAEKNKVSAEKETASQEAAKPWDWKSRYVKEMQRKVREARKTKNDAAEELKKTEHARDLANQEVAEAELEKMHLQSQASKFDDAQMRAARKALGQEKSADDTIKLKLRSDSNPKVAVKQQVPKLHKNGANGRTVAAALVLAFLAVLRG
eukprot:TRINITY_DN41069_c0_g1_i1.p1 TRINITY_DN41069_c0_g1~~TRINITY_DN41069_c0_g1_i1.p1  ORF type:complete len:457 (-),score=158.92 TRINITY_DN41069_c0_g1_i1:162-1532(-)